MSTKRVTKTQPQDEMLPSKSHYITTAPVSALVEDEKQTAVLGRPWQAERTSENGNANALGSCS